MTTPPSPESIAQGKRFKRLRSLLNLSQGKLAQAIDYSRASVNYWENANNGGLTFEGAMKAIEVSKRYGLICTSDWLLFGEGAPPHFADEVYITDAAAVPSNNAVKHEAEIALFKKQHLTYIIYKVEKSNAISPFIPGDILGGVWIQPSQWLRKEKFLALIEGEGNQLLLCMIQHEKDQTFLKTNGQANNQQMVILDKFVEITRWWRPDYDTAH